MRQENRPFFELVHVPPSFLRRDEFEPTIYGNMFNLNNSGAEVHFVGKSDELCYPYYPSGIMPEVDRLIVLGGGVYSDDPDSLLNCVGKRKSGWESLGYTVIIDHDITLYEGESYKRDRIAYLLE
jgi:hypothetical protein